jgi:hypothetical protein
LLTEDPVKHVCAWCKNHIGGDPASEVVSHGICGGCLEKQLADPLADTHSDLEQSVWNAWVDTGGEGGQRGGA